MFRIKNPVWRLSLFAGILLGLGACAPGVELSQEELDKSHQLRPPYEVEHTTHRHLVPIDSKRVEFREQERRDLYDFLTGVGAQPGDRVIIAARRERMDNRAPIVEFIRRLGLHADTRVIKDPKPGAEDDGYDKAILIQFDRYVVIQPDCGKWGEKVKMTYYNNSLKNFGCASTASLQQQVAYPSSLVAGETLDFPEGDVAAESVSRYRNRQVEELQVEQTK